MKTVSDSKNNLEKANSWKWGLETKISCTLLTERGGTKLMCVYLKLGKYLEPKYSFAQFTEVKHFHLKGI